MDDEKKVCSHGVEVTERVCDDCVAMTVDTVMGGLIEKAEPGDLRDCQGFEHAIGVAIRIHTACEEMIAQGHSPAAVMKQARLLLLTHQAVNNCANERFVESLAKRMIADVLVTNSPGDKTQN